MLSLCLPEQLWHRTGIRASTESVFQRAIEAWEVIVIMGPSLKHSQRLDLTDMLRDFVAFRVLNDGSFELPTEAPSTLERTAASLKSNSGPGSGGESPARLASSRRLVVTLGLWCSLDFRFWNCYESLFSDADPR